MIKIKEKNLFLFFKIHFVYEGLEYLNTTSVSFNCN